MEPTDPADDQKDQRSAETASRDAVQPDSAETEAKAGDGPAAQPAQLDSQEDPQDRDRQPPATDLRTVLDFPGLENMVSEAIESMATEAVVETVRQGILVLDEELRVRAANPSFV